MSFELYLSIRIAIINFHKTIMIIFFKNLKIFSHFQKTCFPRFVNIYKRLSVSNSEKGWGKEILMDWTFLVKVDLSMLIHGYNKYKFYIASFCI